MLRRFVSVPVLPALLFCASCQGATSSERSDAATDVVLGTASHSGNSKSSRGTESGSDDASATKHDAHVGRPDASSQSSSYRDGSPDGARDARKSSDGTLGDADVSDARATDARPQDGSDPDVVAKDSGHAARDGQVEAARDAQADAGGMVIALSPLALTPAFSPAVHDYYVRCAEGANALTVTMTAPTGGQIQLLQPTTTALSQGSVQDISVNEAAAIVVGVRGDAGDDQYWIRCLPHDFPTMEMTLHTAAGTPTPGYYLLGSTLNAYVVGVKGYAMALDGNGVPVWFHRPETVTSGAMNVESLSRNTISFVAQPTDDFTFGTYNGEYEIHDLSAGTTTLTEPSDEPLNAHELRFLPNGDYLMMSIPLETGVDLTGLGSYGENETMADCQVQEVAPTGAIVWEWTATDHFDPVQDSTWPQTDYAGSAPVVDVFHCNAIDLANDGTGDLIVSARNMDSVFRISKSTGKVVWKMGGATYMRDDGAYITVTGDPETAFYAQHDVRVQPNGDISVFDDHSPGSTRVGSYTNGVARGVIYTIDADAGSATPIRQYPARYNINSMGSFRVASDGSAVIGWGQSNNPTFTEIDRDGNDLLDFNFPDGAQSYRVVKVSTSALDLTLLRTTAGLD